MKDLIEALTIFAKYGDPYSPTHCEHDVLTVMIDPADVSDEDKARLDKLGFRAGSEYGDDVFTSLFTSYRFGSA
jgi:hypothetical protein